MNLEKIGFLGVVIIVIIGLLLITSDSLLYILLFAGVAGGGYYFYNKVTMKKSSTTSKMLGRHPPLAQREHRRRQATLCQDAAACASAAPSRYPPVGGEGGEKARNSIRNDQPDTCTVDCVEGFRQPTLPGGHFCGIEDDPNFAPFDARHNLETGLDPVDDHYAADGHRALYMEDQSRIYMRDRNQLMMARRSLIGSTRPTKDWASARQGFNMAVLGNYNVKDDRYMEVVDRRLVNTDFKERNFG